MTSMRSNTLDKILECANKLDAIAKKERTCPECGYRTLGMWIVHASAIRWLECPKCGWHNRPDSVTLVEKKND